MKKIFLILVFASISFNLVKAQFSCSGAVPITNGYAMNGFTTNGNGANSWVTSAAVCGGGTGQTQLPAPLYDVYFTNDGDDYVFSYTTGAVAGESVEFSIKTKTTFTGLMVFTGCNGTNLTGCLQGIASYTYGGSIFFPYPLKVSATNLAANQTIYFAVGRNGGTYGLSFDVTNFTVTAPSLATNEVTVKGNTLDIYPNPVKDFLNINNLKNNSIVSVVDMSGRTVINTTLKKDEKLNVSSLEKGSYIVTVGTKDEKKSYKIVKN